MKAWYVAKIQPQKEPLLKVSLGDYYGVQVFSPWIRRPERGPTSWEPLFPTYLFCRFDPECSTWPTIRWAPGLAYFLGREVGPTPVPEGLVDYLQQRVAWWNEEGHRVSLKPGERVRVVAGPLAGLEGVFQRYVPARQRCLVLLQVLGRLSAVELPEADVWATTHKLVLTG